MIKKGFNEILVIILVRVFQLSSASNQAFFLREVIFDEKRDKKMWGI